jgi:hypothetical protein
VAEAWLKSRHRRQYDGVTFDPALPPGGGPSGGLFNTWRGWGVTPAPGDWSLLRDRVLLDVICRGDRAAFDYALRWVAHLFQRPQELPETAFVVRGAKGTGKSTFGRALLDAAGPHGIAIASSTQVTGRFNGHLMDKVLAYVDEATCAGDRAQNSVLKQLITEPVIAYEMKGRDVIVGRNMTHVYMSSNEEWVVPASLADERRFFVVETDDGARGDRALWEAVHAQLRDGGLQAMLHDLLALPLGGWHPRRDVPHTRALAEQALESMDLEAWWHDLLDRGALPGLLEDDRSRWADAPALCDKDELHADYSAFVGRRGRPKSKDALGRRIARFGVTSTQVTGGARLWKLPRLDDARARFEAMLGVALWNADLLS